MSSSSDPLDVALLKSPDFADWQRHYGGPARDQLPYRLDHLAGEGIRLHWTDAPHRRPWSRGPLAAAVRGLEGLGAPFLQTALLAPAIARAPATLALFESEGNVAAALRSLRLWPLRRSRLAVISCWLAELLPRFGRRRVDLYRRAYSGVDRLYFYSSNQTDILRSYLGLPDERLVCLPFGVDEEFFAPVAGPVGDYTLVVGRDRGRDWATLFDAARRTGIAVKVLCRPSDLAGLEIPPSVEVLGYVDRFTYRELLAGARLVAVPTRVLAYPTGQSVVLEAMAAAKCCVVTDTPAMSDYVSADEVVLVPPDDPGALADALVAVDADEDLRRRLGRRARVAVEARFTARRMWATVAADLLRLVEAPG